MIPTRNPPPEKYVERRVRVSAYRSLPLGDPLLVEVQPGKLLHKAAANLLRRMLDDAAAAGFKDVKIQSAHRRRRWRDRAHYEATLVRRYGSVQKGRRWLAYASPHETGLAVDFGSHGLFPRSKTAEQQKRAPFFAWLKENAYRYGWHPYKAEPWHWECPLPSEVFEGEALSPFDGPPW